MSIEDPVSREASVDVGTERHMREEIARARGLDHTLAFLRAPYDFFQGVRMASGADSFEARILLQPALVVCGEDAARMFLSERVRRLGAVPPHSSAPDQSEAPRSSKPFSAEAVERIGARFERAWIARLQEWVLRGRVCILSECESMLMQAFRDWAGVPLTPPGQKDRLSSDIRATCLGPSARPIESADRLFRRWRLERWARGLIRDARVHAPPGGRVSPLVAVARFAEADGARPSLAAAARAFLDLLRPAIASARFVQFAAHALTLAPEWRDRLAAPDAHRERRAFALEVRRFYPFACAIFGEARETFVWRDRKVRRGDLIVLDVHGLNHDARLWPEPSAFRPARFLEGRAGAPLRVLDGATSDAADFPDDDLSVALMERALRLLTGTMRYEVETTGAALKRDRTPAAFPYGLWLTRIQIAQAAAISAAA